MDIESVELVPGSPAAKRMGCSCCISAGTQFKADPNCTLHGVLVLKRLRRLPDGMAAIERFRRHVDEASRVMGQTGHQLEFSFRAATTLTR